MLGPSCRDVARWVGRDELSAAGFWQRTLIRLHLLRCRHCAAYARQIEALGHWARGYSRGDTPSPNALARMKRAFDRHLARLRRVEPEDMSVPPEST